MRLAEPRFTAPAPEEPSRASTEEIEEIARSRMEGARVDILLDHPYFAATLLAIPMRGTFDEAITHAMLTDGTRIVYRRDLVAALGRPQVRMLIMHALAHVLLRHPERGGARNWDAWTAACDIAVDLLFQILGVVADRDLALLREFQSLSAEAIYEKLVSNADATPPSAFSRSPHARGDGMQPPPVAPEGREPPSRSAGDDGRGAFERAMDGAECPTKMRLEGLRTEFARGIRGGGNSAMAGSQPGNAGSEIDAAEREQVCWQQVLARFMRDAIDREWSFARPNRKHLWRGIYLPGPVEIDGGRFVVAIDTSGSMSDAALAVMIGEVDAIRRTCACELTVLQFDAAIHATAEFSRWNDEDETIGTTKVMRVYGRGGTDLRLPFTWAEEERRKGRQISALIVCTDGYGPLPSKAPAGLPVLFVLTPQHSAPTFGEQLVLGRQFDGVSARQGGAYSSPVAAGAQAGPAVAGVPAYVPSWGPGRSSRGRMI